VSAPEPATLDFAAGWEASSLKRERSEATTAVVFTGVLVPLWIAFDAFLEPELLETFTVMRLVATAAAWGVLPIIRRARTVRAVRAWMTAEIALSGATIALMLPHVRHFPAYVFGFSLYFWGMGAVLSWPARWSVGLFAWLLGVMSAGFVAWPGMRSPADYVAVGFYVGSAAVIATIMNFIRYRMVREAFAVSHQLAMRNADVERTIEQLREAQARLVASEKLSALGRLLAGLSHEINNPLNVLQNNLEPLRASLDGLLDLARLAGSATPPDLPALRRRCADLGVEATARDVEDAAEMMRAAMGRVRQVHSDLRAFIRGDAPGMVLEDPSGGLRATAALLARRLPEGVRVEVDVGPLPRTTCQPGQLNQVWHNLIQNALDAVGAAGSVWVRARAVADGIEVTVADTGPGVAPEHQARLFEPFFTTKGLGKGTGLGLAMSYQIVERHGGAMFLDGGYTGGARFVIRLPVRVVPGAAPLVDPAARAG
jgi:signal transduction histidine kinase